MLDLYSTEGRRQGEKVTAKAVLCVIRGELPWCDPSPLQREQSLDVICQANRLAYIKVVISQSLCLPVHAQAVFNHAGADGIGPFFCWNNQRASLCPGHMY